MPENRNFRCEITEAACTNSKCKKGNCILEVEHLPSQSRSSGSVTRRVSEISPSEFYRTIKRAAQTALENLELKQGRRFHSSRRENMLIQLMIDPRILKAAGAKDLRVKRYIEKNMNVEGL
jgi:hypothetical protein